MRIGILGAGTAGAIAALQIINFIKLSKEPIRGINITVIHDPNIETAQVGESLSSYIYSLLMNTLDEKFGENLNEYNGTLRYYTKHFWKDVVGDDFNVYYYNPGLHVNSEKFSKYVIKKLVEKHNVTEIHDTVANINHYDEKVLVEGQDKNYNFDYLIDSRGAPTSDIIDSPLYETNVFQSVNSVLLYQNYQTYDEPYTSSYAHKDGWMFGVPLSYRKAFGYLYNNNITTDGDAFDNFKKIHNIKDPASIRKISWKPYYKNIAFENRILVLGNKLYFFEPQQALPLHYYAYLVRYFIKTLLTTNVLETESLVNHYHLVHMNAIQDLIALTYSGTNLLDSEFWKETKSKAVYRLLDSVLWQEHLQTSETAGERLRYFLFEHELLNNYIDGLKIDLASLKRPDVVKSQQYDS